MPCAPASRAASPSPRFLTGSPGRSAAARRRRRRRGCVPAARRQPGCGAAPRAGQAAGAGGRCRAGRPARRGAAWGRGWAAVPQHRAGAQPAPPSLFPPRTSGPDPPSDLGSSSCPQPSPLAPSPRRSPLTCRARQQLSTQEHIFSGEQAGRAGLPAPGTRWPPPFMLLPPPCCLPHLVGQGPTPPGLHAARMGLNFHLLRELPQA